MFREAALKTAPGADGPLLDLLAAGDAERHRRLPRRHRSAGGERPAGRAAGAVSPSFKDTPASREYLASLLRAFHDYPVAVELRHKSWSDALGDTLSLLNGFGAAFTQIDEPKFRLSIRQNYLPNVTSFYYMRLHGRNAAQWWAHDKTRGPLQLPVFRRRAARVRGRRGRGARRW